MTSRALRVALLAVICAAQAIAVMPLASADPVPAQATWEEVWFPSEDDTMLHADVFLPKHREADERHPVILSIGPYFGSGGSGPDDVTPLNEGPVLRFRDLMYEGRIFERGYAYVQVDLRGTGGSQGCYDLGGPGEQMDVKAAIEWAAGQPWSTGKVGMWGKSYDAWTQVMALAGNPKGLAATVMHAPLTELYRGLFMNGVSYGWETVPAKYGQGDLKPPSLRDSSTQELLYSLDGLKTPDCYIENSVFSQDPDPSKPFWQERMLVERAGRSRVPVLWSHGMLEWNTRPDNFIDLWELLRGPKRAWVGQFHHVRGNEVALVGRDGFMAEAMGWLDHYLKGKRLQDAPIVEVQDNSGKWRSENMWPPDDAGNHSLSMNPGSYQDVRGNDAWAPDLGTWTFTQPAPYDLRFAGEPRLHATVETVLPRVNVVALLYDVAPDGTARLISRGASLAATGKLAFDLYPQDWVLERGHRFGLNISGSDEQFFSPTPTGTSVHLIEVRLSLPFLRFHRAYDLSGGAAAAMEWVPEVRLSGSTIEQNERTVRFPNRMRPPRS